MTGTRVEIGKLIVRGGKFSRVEGAALGWIVESHLSQLLSQGGPPKSRQAGTVQIEAGPHHPRSNVAGTVARAVYRTISGKN